MKQSVTVLGAGAWGSAIAHLLATNGNDVTLWCHESEVAESINKSHCNKHYLPSTILPDTVHATTSLPDALANATWIFEAIPVQHIRSVLMQCKGLAPYDAAWVLLSKGIEQQTLLLPSQILQQVVGADVRYAVLGGPNFAAELVERALTATVVASTDDVLVKKLSLLVANDYFKTCISDDPVGVQIGGAVKNVLALTIGFAHGVGYKYHNTMAYLFSQGLAEAALLAERLGGKKETMYGLAGLGDIVLSCTGTMSKNFRLGMLLGQGLPIEQAAKKFSVVPEGMNTLQSLHEIVQQSKLHLPLCMGAYRCIYEGFPFKQALLSL